MALADIQLEAEEVMEEGTAGGAAVSHSLLLSLVFDQVFVFSHCCSLSVCLSIFW